MSHYEPTKKDVEVSSTSSTLSTRDRNRYININWKPEYPIILSKRAKRELKTLPPPLNVYTYPITGFKHMEVINLAITYSCCFMFSCSQFMEYRAVPLHLYTLEMRHSYAKSDLYGRDLTFKSIIDNVPDWFPVFPLSSINQEIGHFLKQITGVEVKPSTQFVFPMSRIRMQNKVNLLSAGVASDEIEKIEVNNSYRDKTLSQHFYFKPLIYLTDSSLSIQFMGVELYLRLSYVDNSGYRPEDNDRYRFVLSVALIKESDLFHRSGINAQFDFLYRDCGLPSDIALLIIEQQFACCTKIVDLFMMFCVAHIQDYSVNSYLSVQGLSALDIIPRLHTKNLDAYDPTFRKSAIICSHISYHICRLLNHGLLIDCFRTLTLNVASSLSFEYFLPYDSKISSDTILQLENRRFGPATEGSIIDPARLFKYNHN